MNENFAKFKKKVWIDILIKCIVAATLVAFVAVNAALIPCKLYGIRLLWVYYILIGLGGFALGGGIAFLILRTDDKKIAKRMDAELCLAERVQTAFVYSGQKSDMLELQRQNTSETLNPIPARSLPFKGLIATVLCGIIALTAIVSVPVAAFAVPPVLSSNRQDGDKKDPPRQVTDWEWAALDDLIKYVRESQKADADSKSGMISELDSLRNLLLDGVSQSSLSNFVTYTVTQIQNVVKDANEKYPTTSGTDEEGKPITIYHPQTIANSEEASYVVTRLYEIFKLLPNGDGGDSGNSNGGNNNENKGDEPIEGDGGKGTININDTPFFDPERGFVMCGEVRGDYYEAVQSALAEGIISAEEWEYIMVTYFANLGVKDEE